MNSLVLLLLCLAVLICGYIFYGRWLCKQWGVGEKDQPTPAHEMEDGVDYVPAKAPVLMGHHFSSIAGAGPITGPIGAAIFGWIPVVLWILIGGIFFGGVHDFGALFASIRHKGQSIGEIRQHEPSRKEAVPDLCLSDSDPGSSGICLHRGIHLWGNLCGRCAG